jgi:hypothetical protein
MISNFYVAAYEAGVLNAPVAVWASEIENPLHLKKDTLHKIEKVEIATVPGAFQLLNVLNDAECETIILASEAMQYSKDSSISLPRSVRHNDNLVWIIDDDTHDCIWQRCVSFIPQALSLNKRFRFYRYKKGNYFEKHTDGAWPGSAINNKKVIHNFYHDRFSKMTFLIFLSDDFEGGKTQFLVNGDAINITTPKGAVLCFPHGIDPRHCVHSSAPIIEGIKYIIRSDILFSIG